MYNIEDIKDTIINGEVLEILKQIPSESIDMCITSPPYWQCRDYGVEGQIGLEYTTKEFVNKLSDIFMEVHRVLKNEGSCWVNIRDTYSKGIKRSGVKKQKFESHPRKIGYKNGR